MSGIPIIVTKKTENGKIKIKTTTLTKEEFIKLHTSNKINCRGQQNQDSSSIMKRSNEVPEIEKNSNLKYAAMSKKKSKHFETLDYKKQIINHDIGSCHPGRGNYEEEGKKIERGKTENNENSEEQDFEKQNKVRIRRIQSSGTRRKFPKDFFSQEAVKPQKNSISKNDRVNARKTIQEKNLYSEKKEKKQWMTLQYNKHDSIDHVEYLMQKENHEYEETPKFQSKDRFLQKRGISKTQAKYQKPVSKQYADRCSINGNINKLTNFTVNKKKYSKNLKKNSSASSTNKIQDHSRNNNGLSMNSTKQLQDQQKNVRLDFLENTFAVVPLQQISYNATFGQNDWLNKQTSFVSCTNKFKQGKQNENEQPPRVQANSKKNGATSFRENFVKRISGLKQKNNYFLSKKLLQQ